MMAVDTFMKLIKVNNIDEEPIITNRPSKYIRHLTSMDIDEFSDLYGTHSDYHHKED